jgi:glycosyltransferase involved in cell wall biosynthesis
MLLKWPKVSVIISTYNRPDMLREAIQSVVDQTFRDFEVLVVDDGSNTAKDICEEFQDLDVSVMCLELKTNSGYQSMPKNIGIQYSRGSYIAYLDDDNTYDVDHLQILVDEIEKMGCDAVYSRWRYRGDGPGSGRDSEFTPMSMASITGLMQGPQMNFIDTSAVLHSKSAFFALLGKYIWNPELRRFGDWELVSRSLNAGLRFRAVDKVTFTYNWHGENLQLVRPPDESTARAR